MRSSWKAWSSAEETSLLGACCCEAELKVTMNVTSKRSPKEKYCSLAMMEDLVSAFFDRGSPDREVGGRDVEVKSSFSGSANLLSLLAEFIFANQNYGQGILGLRICLSGLKESRWSSDFKRQAEPTNQRMEGYSVLAAGRCKPDVMAIGARELDFV